MVKKVLKTDYILLGLAGGVMASFSSTMKLPQLLVLAVFFGLFSGIIILRMNRLEIRIKALEVERQKIQGEE